MAFINILSLAILIIHYIIVGIRIYFRELKDIFNMRQKSNYSLTKIINSSNKIMNNNNNENYVFKWKKNKMLRIYKIFYKI